jgi:hypothetical protein
MGVLVLTGSAPTNEKRWVSLGLRGLFGVVPVVRWWCFYQGCMSAYTITQVVVDLPFSVDEGHCKKSPRESVCNLRPHCRIYTPCHHSDRDQKPPWSPTFKTKASDWLRSLGKKKELTQDLWPWQRETILFSVKPHIVTRSSCPPVFTKEGSMRMLIHTILPYQKISSIGTPCHAKKVAVIACKDIQYPVS